MKTRHKRKYTFRKRIARGKSSTRNSYQSKYAVQMAETAKCEHRINSLEHHISRLKMDLEEEKKIRKDLINQLIDYERGNKLMPIAAIPAPNSAIAVHAEPW